MHLFPNSDGGLNVRLWDYLHGQREVTYRRDRTPEDPEEAKTIETLIFGKPIFTHSIPEHIVQKSLIKQLYEAFKL